MVGNEERVILRMLESSYKYIDYWVIQCNGSDKTQSIIEEFYKEKIYLVLLIIMNGIILV